MENLKSYERYLDFVGENWDADMQKESCMSEKAMSKMKKLCRKHLIREANEYHNDMNGGHTYDKYVNECQNMLKEMLGQPGYQGIHKTSAE